MEPLATGELTKLVHELQQEVARVDRQSRCRHVWEPDRDDPAKRICAECGCRPLKDR